MPVSFAAPLSVLRCNINGQRERSGRGLLLGSALRPNTGRPRTASGRLRNAPLATRFTLYIVVAMILGIVAGHAIHQEIVDPAQLKDVVGYFSIVTDAFLRLIKMIIALLVFSTLVMGIAHMGDTSSLGRVGVRTLAWFLLASVISLALGIVMVTWLDPGAELGLPLPTADAAAQTGVKAGALTLKEFVTHLVPKSPVEAMANNEILQIVVFSVFFGVGLGAVGDKGRVLLQAI